MSLTSVREHDTADSKPFSLLKGNTLIENPPMYRFSILLFRTFLIFALLSIFGCGNDYADYRIEDRVTEDYLGMNIVQVKKEMSDAKKVFQTESEISPYDSTFKWEYLPPNIEDGDITELYEKISLLVNVDRKGYVRFVMKTMHHKNKKSLSSYHTGAVATLINKYGISKCSRHGSFFTKEEPFTINPSRMGDWKYMKRCRTIRWGSINNKKYYGSDYNVSISLSSYLGDENEREIENKSTISAEDSRYYEKR